MFFSIDYKNKIIFGWSAKCGCSHIKNIFWFLQSNNIDNPIHTRKDISKLPKDIQNYTTLIFSRNPYKRIISGFLDKYRKDGEFRIMWKEPFITFSTFVDTLIKKEWNNIDRHHFTPQTTEDFNINILKSKSIKFYDIENIDYKYIEKLYNKEIPEYVLNKKEGHERRLIASNYETLDKYVYDLDIDEIVNYNIDIKYFYNEEIKNKIFTFYKNDFNFFNKYGHNYKF